MGFSRQNAGVGCHFLLQGIFLTQELNPGLLHCRQILYQLSYEGSSNLIEIFINSVHIFEHISWLVLEKEMASHSSTLAWKIPWIEMPDRLQSMGSLSWIRLSEFAFTLHFHALEKEMATHSSVLAWRIPGTGEPGGLPSVGSHRVRHD